LASPSLPSPALLFASVIYAEEESAVAALAAMSERYGQLEYCSPASAFDHTSYYGPEMGPNLKRRIIAFEQLVGRASLPAIKLYTNAIERRLSDAAGQRRVNLDPGFVTLEQVTLATTKPYSHRIYLSEGIWAELCLTYRDQTYHELAWTYPDYASAEMVQTMLDLRKIYGEKLKCQRA
jgi:hypothetical protein